MRNLLEQAIDCDDGDHAARLIRDALGIESDEVTNYVFPKRWPNDRRTTCSHHRRMAYGGSSISGRTVDRAGMTAPIRRFPAARALLLMLLVAAMAGILLWPFGGLPWP
jgi:hypothetical protein